VFEESKITLSELIKVLEADFEGHEPLYQMLLECPKYGNDDDYVDAIAREWYDFFWQEFQRLTDHLGKQARAITASVSWHHPLGARTGALPGGRKAGLPLADGSVSPSPGQDKKGPTALIRSASKVVDTTRFASSILNMKFHPSALETSDGLRRLVALIKTYMDLGGHHIQFNVVSTDTLKDAQLHPENYRNFIVRVAGFSAFFIHLDPAIQDEIIRRSELTFEH
jgi:formate C-acetyltransferase